MDELYNEKDCVFCNLMKEKDAVITHFEPLNPVVEGHLLVVHGKHTKDFTEDWFVSQELMNYASRLAKRLGGEYNLITSAGKNATQSVFHTHIHLVPRKEGDGLTLPWTGQKV